MKLRGAIVGAVLLIASISSAAYSWDNFGHMTVAYVCYKNLKPDVRTRVDVLIKLNPMYHQWEQQVGKTSLHPDKEALIFMLAATWLDAIKGNHDYSSY